jgi:hypothetical protein
VASEGVAGLSSVSGDLVGSRAAGQGKGQDCESRQHEAALKPVAAWDSFFTSKHDPMLLILRAP